MSRILDPMKKLIWMGSSREDLRAFPRQARREMGYQLENVQEGVDPDDLEANVNRRIGGSRDSR